MSASIPNPQGPLAQQAPIVAGMASAPLGAGLLAPSGQSYGPPPLPNVPGLIPGSMKPTGMALGQEQALMILLPKQRDDIPPDDDDDLPGQLQAYAKGLRPAVRPEGVGWQQEIIYERLGKSDYEIQGIVSYYFKNAQQYDNYLFQERVAADRYYRGEGFGDEDQLRGRSHLVLTTVRDTIRSTLPSLLRIFTGVADPVEFEPISYEITGPDAEVTTAKMSRQATDYARWALFTANPGWQILHDALLNALTRKAGWVRWRWGKVKQSRTEVAHNLLLPQLQMLLAQPGIECQRVVRRPMTQEEQTFVQRTPDGMMYLQGGGAPEFWSVTIHRTAQEAKPVVESVPSDQVWIVPDANTVEEARAVFHIRDLPASDLIEMGLPEHDVLSNTVGDMSIWRRAEAVARDPITGYNMRGGPPNDKSMALCRYTEGWIRCDADNDHQAELLHVHCLGDMVKLIQWERTDEIPLACFTPYREPGRVIGYSQADMVMDLQRLQSKVMRATLDSLGQAMFPRTVMTLGQVNQADVRQTAIGSIIRVAQQGAVTELVKPFAGKEALPILDVLEAIRESRTGITRASQGLTVDELQSTAPIAVSQQTSAAQDRLDMMARTLAETGLAPLYRGLFKLLASHQDRPNTIRIKGEWVPIDPRVLATQWEVAVNIGGKGMPMERLAMLSQIAGKQEMIMQQGGMQNPLVGIPEYRNTLARMLETANIADVSSYFKALPPGWQPPPPNNQPTDSQLLAMAQQQKNAADLETDRGKAQTDRAKMLTDDDRERDKAAIDAWTRLSAAAMTAGQPLPNLAMLQQAMRSKAPQLGLMPDVPPATSPQQPATGVQSMQPPQPQQGQPGPMGPKPPPQRPMMPNPVNPVQMPTPATSPNPAMQMGVARGLMGGGLPSAYGALANRAISGLIAGPGGPPIPRPGGPTPGMQ